MTSPYFHIEAVGQARILRLTSPDGTNRLTRACVLALTQAVATLARDVSPLVISGNRRYFSVGADLGEIKRLSGAEARDFAALGQTLMNGIAEYPGLVIAAVEGHAMGGGFDLALACHRRIAAPNAVFAHRGAALGLITGWGGTQRLPGLIGKGRALDLLVTAEKVNAKRALDIGLVSALAEEPVAEALAQIH